MRYVFPLPRFAEERKEEEEEEVNNYDFSGSWGSVVSTMDNGLLLQYSKLR